MTAPRRWGSLASLVLAALAGAVFSGCGGGGGGGGGPAGPAYAQEAYVKASNTDPGDTFGNVVAISGDTMLVGAENESSASEGVDGDPSDDSLPFAGAAYVYVRSGTAWSPQAYLKAESVDEADRFGASVGIDGDTVVVGVPWEDGGDPGQPSDDGAVDSGAAYVYVRTGTTWTQQAYLKASNFQAGDAFGYDVAISGDTIVVGARHEESAATGIDGDQGDDSAPYAGAAYVFVRTGTTWTQQAYLKASNASTLQYFGAAVAISGDTIVAGAIGEASAATGVNGDQADVSAPFAGAAYVFVRSGTTWMQQAYLKASNADEDDSFGQLVAISGATIVIGTYFEDSAATGIDGDEADDSANGAGAAYVFVRSGTTWSQQAYLKASNAEAFDHFAASVAVSGDVIVVGASGESSAATGVNGDPTDDSAFSAGAAYVFARSGDDWAQVAYLKASNTGAADAFGYAVAASGDSIAVTARDEPSAATGVGGDQANDGAPAAGAVYVFREQAP